MCAYYSAHFTDADIEFTKKGIFRNHNMSCMLVFRRAVTLLYDIVLHWKCSTQVCRIAALRGPRQRGLFLGHRVMTKKNE